MASGYNAGRFNLALACAAAGATAFALLTVPDAGLQAGLEATGFSQMLSASSGAATRFGVTTAAASLVFLLVWLTLRSCDPPVRQAGADAQEDNWPLSLLVSGGGSEMGPEDPFAALARGAKRVDDPFELVAVLPDSSEIAPIPDPDGADLGPRELLARLPYSIPSRADAPMQQLDAGLVASEWPLPAGESEEQAEEMDDRLRHVLQDLKMIARRG
jgi:hypothetical protein